MRPAFRFTTDRLNRTQIMDSEQDEHQIQERLSLALFADDKESSIRIYDDVIARFALRGETKIDFAVARAMYYKRCGKRRGSLP